MKLSVVIIARNEAHIIGNTLQSLLGLTDDVVVVDSGSTDGTQEICRQYGATVLPITWNGYGAAKNQGNTAAKYNWILSLDADEAIDDVLKHELTASAEPDSTTVFEIRFKTFLCQKEIRFGEWGGDKHIRLFNKTLVKWNDAGVHEGLTLGDNTTTQQLNGYILHYTADNLAEYKQKTEAYARLNAGKYFERGKTVSPFKKYLSAGFSFIQNYFFRLGFLDGKSGLWIAKNTARYTWLKYAHLEVLYKNTG